MPELGLDSNTSIAELVAEQVAAQITPIKEEFTMAMNAMETRAEAAEAEVQRLLLERMQVERLQETDSVRRQKQKKRRREEFSERDKDTRMKLEKAEQSVHSSEQATEEVTKRLQAELERAQESQESASDKVERLAEELQAAHGDLQTAKHASERLQGELHSLTNKHAVLSDSVQVSDSIPFFAVHFIVFFLLHPTFGLKVQYLVG
jgi:chromosome segregation ATPase